MSTPPVRTEVADLQSRLPELTLRDQRRLQRRLDGIPKIRKPGAAQAATAQIAAEIDAAAARVERRRAAVPTITYPDDLPIAERRDVIMAAIRDHQVVVVAGETGSGKTTQLPKMCLELGRGVRGLVGHTQPRRIAARTVAQRVAEELGTPLGSAVGYQVRFTERAGEDTLVKVMTDGILLTEITHDRSLYRYDTLIIDEAHERSLNIDFILGYLRQLLPRRPDLKVIITSATIDPQRFAEHFGPDVPIIEVSGRTYPVEIRYRPLVEIESADDADDEADDGAGGETERVRDQIEAICDAVEELRAERPGDVLVFLSGEREIRDTADALAKLGLPNTEILPLYARLSLAEQHRVFEDHPGRRIVLATNVAETSLTVPGIRYVIDPGNARISRYSNRTKVQRLPIEPVSQASARQRAGRCGRLSDGICIRLYAESDFAARPAFTDPEILRTNLASVILQMTSLGLGDLAAFPFLDPPERRNINDGIQLLHELGALEPAGREPAGRNGTGGDGGHRLTALGRRLAQLPVDPRLGRMVLAAEEQGCVDEVLVLAAALSIQDPRERPADKQQAAAERHARFVDPDSDFTAYLNLWRFLQEQQKELSSSQFRRLCRTDFLNYLRAREWQDLYGQLRQVVRQLGMSVNDTPADPQRTHAALLAGLLSHVGLKDGPKQEYLGARGARFAIVPGSALFKKSPRWVVAAELVETSRLWGRIVAKVEPEWVEALAGHLVKREYSEPHWSKRQGAAMATERVTLYGLPLVTNRKVNYGRIDPPVARELFIRHALVEGDWETQHKFFAANRALLEDVEELEHRVRRRDILVDEEALFAFYDRRIGAEVVSARHFDTWWKEARRTRPDLLTFHRSMLINANASGVSELDYPGTWQQGDLRLDLSYRFEPGGPGDGVTVTVPLPVLSLLEAENFTWQVPGMRHDLVTALIRSLPKALRVNFVPAPDFAADVLARVGPGDGRLLDMLERELRSMTGVVVPREAWQLDRVPDHLRMTFRVVDGQGRTLAEGKDLAALRRQLIGEVKATLQTVADGLTRQGLRSWDLGTLPRTVERTVGGYPVVGYPALVDAGDSVSIGVLPTAAEQQAAMAAGTRRLLQLTIASPVKAVNARLSNQVKLALSRNPYRNAAELLDDCVACGVDALMAEYGGPAWDEAGFAALRERVRADLPDTVYGIVEQVRHILAAAYAVEQRLKATSTLALVPALTDIRGQLSRLVYPGFVAATGARHLAEVPRYLRAIERRLDKLPENPGRDRVQMLKISEIEQEYAELAAAASGPALDAVREIRWMIEELRVNAFAQALGTAYPISDKRIYRAMDELAVPA
ncbi:MAG TPA: ATP-dependent RNA helicase HrpA [Micromonosporaceae bacterium]|nr:ATP-dependent RNA helicase HrpA [Micromonosporaceae bacterium]